MSERDIGGMRAARDLLTLLAENSPEDFEAAEAVLADPELKQILRQLRKFKADETPSLEWAKLRDIVRGELARMNLRPSVMASVLNATLPVQLRRTPSTTTEQIIDRALTHIDEAIEFPPQQIEALTVLLRNVATLAGEEESHKTQALFRDLATRALVGNELVHPTLHSLAKLRTLWGKEPLPYSHGESRRSLVTRLLDNAEQEVPPAERVETMRLLLQRGMRGPADAAIAEVRQLNRKKAHGGQG